MALELLAPPKEEVDMAVKAFAAARGNIHLAAEYLHMPPTHLTALLLEDPDGLAKHLRTLALINLFEATAMAHQILKGSMADMEPYECSKTYSNLLATAEALTSPRATGASQQTNVQINLGQLLEQLPEDVGQAVQFLIKEQAS